MPSTLILLPEILYFFVGSSSVSVSIPSVSSPDPRPKISRKIVYPYLPKQREVLKEDIAWTKSTQNEKYRQAPLRRFKSASWPDSFGYGGVDRTGRDYRPTFLHLIPRRRFDSGSIHWLGSYQRIYDLFPTVRTLLGTMLGLRLARVITRGKLSTDTAAGRSTCRSFRSVNENETGAHGTPWIWRG